jgi:thioredoxin-related protein
MKSMFASAVVLSLLIFQPARADDIAWEKIQNGSVEAAFAKAKQQNKPLFLYWGAVWCPPCNQVKATVFNRKDFVAQTKSFIPVYLDGDAPGAQKIASQFNVRAYPTTILLKPDGKEIMRLPGEVDPLRYVQLLAQGVRHAIPMAELVKRAALTKTAGNLTEKDWETLAFYSWDLDDASLAKPEARATLLRTLAQACPTSHAVAKQRLLLKALALHGKDKDLPLKQSVDSFAAVVNDPRNARLVYDILLFSPAELLEATTKIDEKLSARLRVKISTLLDTAAEDKTLSWNDRISAIGAKFELLSDEQKLKPPSSWVNQATNVVSAANSGIKNKFERQSVIPNAADVLTSYGLVEQSNQLLKAELPVAVAPYYHMLGLSANAKKQGNKGAALEWSQKAFETSVGPATKVQWGSSYVRSLVELSPSDTARIEKASLAVIQGLEPTPDTFYERNSRSLARMGNQLHQWNTSPERALVLQRLQSEVAKVCVKLPTSDAARQSCDDVLAAPKNNS